MSRDQEFGAYVAERRAHLYRSAWMLCGDPHRAEDLVQEALTKLYVAWPRLSRIGNVDAYVRRMIVNGKIDDGRRPWRRESPTAQVPDLTPMPQQAEDDLWEALHALPAGQRRVVVLRHYWGLSIEETAADLGVGIGTVKSQTSVALAALRRALAHQSEPALATTNTNHPGGAR